MSVILVVRNGERFIAQALESIQGSRLRPTEILVVDGASTDAMVSIAQGFALVRIVAQAGRGIPDAYNQGIDEASSRYLAFISHDDLWLPGKLDIQIDYLERHPETDAVLGHVELLKAHDRHRTHLWPSPEQALLLQAALLDGEAALDAFRAWRGGVDLDAELGYPVLKLLPLVHQNLLRLGCDDPLMGRLKGLSRRFWCEGQTLFFALTPALERLAAAGVDLLLLKGAPLVLSYYGNHALRPMADLDIAVPHDRLAQAIDLLKEDGWQVENPPGPDTLRYFHAARCTNGRLELDIHYHFLRECVCLDADRWFWSDSASPTP